MRHRDIHVTREVGYAHNFERKARVDLGLELLMLCARPKQDLTLHDIAAWCGCTHQGIRRIERAALRKLRRWTGDALAREVRSA
ncbi:RNA polymerase sigma factor, sigma-70 family [Opitutaceae bacterium TAV1]|nr:RNA polymerase sigma factor, sigma-70 family [Opitutaceae bacterium TAV1]